MPSPSFPAVAARTLLLGLVLLGLASTRCTQESSRPSAVAPAGSTALSAGGQSFLAPGTFDVVLDSDVPYVKTPQPVVDTMLSMANVTASDVVYDLGSGNGRIPIRAAHLYGARAVGIEIQPDLVEKARANAQKAGVADRVSFREGDLFEADISEATVVTLYLIPSINIKLRPKLFRELDPGTRVVSHDFDMNEWTPDSSWSANGERVYLWTIPEETPSFIKDES